jgi:hypothetical protein
MPPEVEQVPIAADDDFGASGDGAGDDVVVVEIAGDGVR